MPELLWNRAPTTPVATLVLAHGAGAPMDSPFMATMAGLLAERGIEVARFEFAYMARRREEGIKAPPDRAPRLMACFQAVLDEVDSDSGVVRDLTPTGGPRRAPVAHEPPAARDDSPPHASGAPATPHEVALREAQATRELLRQYAAEGTAYATSEIFLGCSRMLCRKRHAPGRRTPRRCCRFRS